MGWATYYIEKLKIGEIVQFRPRGNSMIGKVFVFLFRIKMKQIIWCFLILSGFMTSCRSGHKVFPYYYSEDFALFKLNQYSDSIGGSIFWINRKDSTKLKGTIQDGIFEFNSYMNGVDERMKCLTVAQMLLLEVK